MNFMARSMLHRAGFLFSPILSAEEIMNYFNILKSLKTFLVDDDEFIRDSLNIAFTNNGCFLETAENAEEGFQALKKERFDIIISDLKLPGKDGLEFFRTVRSSQPQSLCVLITAYRDKIISSQVSAMGIHDFIEKPFSVGLLVQSLVEMIQSRSNN